MLRFSHGSCVLQAYKKTLSDAVRECMLAKVKLTFFSPTALSDLRSDPLPP